MKPTFILASSSPRRMAILNQLGYIFESVTPRITEPKPDASWTPINFARSAARKKVEDPFVQHSCSIILAADTIVTINDRILGKPTDEQEARKMLGQLSGTGHEVITALALKIGDSVQIRHESTHVVFRKLSQDDISWYVSSGECLDKAGAYGIQGLGAALVESVSGCYYNVVGLPVSLMIQMLREYSPEFWPPNLNSQR